MIYLSPITRRQLWGHRTDAEHYSYRTYMTSSAGIDELQKFAEAIGINPAWVQFDDYHYFLLNEQQRHLAIQNGAQALPQDAYDSLVEALESGEAWQPESKSSPDDN